MLMFRSFSRIEVWKFGSAEASKLWEGAICEISQSCYAYVRSRFLAVQTLAERPFSKTAAKAKKETGIVLFSNTFPPETIEIQHNLGYAYVLAKVVLVRCSFRKVEIDCGVLCSIESFEFVLALFPEQTKSESTRDHTDTDTHTQKTVNRSK